MMNRRVACTGLAALLAAISALPAGIGNLGRTTTTGTGSSDVTLSVNPTYTQPVSAGQLISNVRDLLVAQVNDPNGPGGFAAATIVDPTDPNSNSFQVTTSTSGEVGHFKLCSTDASIDNIGVTIASGRDSAVLLKATTINGNGNYIVSISTLAHGTTTQTFNTGLPATNTPAGLNATIISSFTAAGFQVIDDGTNLTFRRPTDSITTMRVSSTDTGVVNLCVDVITTTGLPFAGSVPTVGTVGMFVMVLLLTGSAIWMLGRRPTPRARS